MSPRLSTVVAALGTALAAVAFAADDAPHLRWRKTYAEALAEARIRNVPVYVTRHKDG